MIDQIMKLAKEIFEDDTLVPCSKVEEANRFDSMNLVQFIIELSDCLDMEIDDEDVERNMSFEEIAKKLEEKKSLDN